MAEPAGIIPKSRLEALTDGVFAFAMTLLVINLVLPGDFRPTSGAELLAALRHLDSAFIAYVITFVVLGVRWLARARVKDEPEVASNGYAWAVLFHLFFITCMPFSTMVVGRYGDLPPAVWLYAANIILSSLTSLRISYLAERESGRRPTHSGRVDLAVLIASALLSVAISLVAADWAMLAYLLNFATPWVRRWTGER